MALGQVNINTYGGQLLDAGYEGMVVDMQTAQIDNFANTGAGAIDFGIAVASNGSGNEFLAPDGCKAPAADADKIIGISVRHPTQVGAPGTGYIAYQVDDMVPVARDCKVHCSPYENVTAGDQVLSITAQGGRLGGTTGGAAGAGRVVVPGAFWLDTTAAAGLGRIRIKS